MRVFFKKIYFTLANRITLNALEKRSEEQHEQLKQYRLSLQREYLELVDKQQAIENKKTGLRKHIKFEDLRLHLDLDKESKRLTVTINEISLKCKDIDNFFKEEEKLKKLNKRPVFLQYIELL
jgi:hypothetical protein